MYVFIKNPLRSFKTLLISLSVTPMLATHVTYVCGRQNYKLETLLTKIWHISNCFLVSFYLTSPTLSFEISPTKVCHQHHCTHEKSVHRYCWKLLKSKYNDCIFLMLMTYLRCHQHYQSSVNWPFTKTQAYVKRWEFYIATFQDLLVQVQKIIAKFEVYVRRCLRKIGVSEAGHQKSAVIHNKSIEMSKLQSYNLIYL